MTEEELAKAITIWRKQNVKYNDALSQIRTEFPNRMSNIEDAPTDDQGIVKELEDIGNDLSEHPDPVNALKKGVQFVLSQQSFLPDRNYYYADILKRMPTDAILEPITI